MPQYSLEQSLKKIRDTNPRIYENITIDLTSARDNEPLYITGDSLTVGSIDGILQVRFNDNNNALISLVNVRRVNTPWHTLFLTNTAQAGKSVNLLIGREASFDVATMLNASNVSGIGTIHDPVANPTATLDCDGRSTVEYFVSEPTGGKTVNIYGSIDGATWRLTKTVLTGAVTKLATDVLSIGFRYIKIEVVSVDAGDYVLELSASN